MKQITAFFVSVLSALLFWTHRKNKRLEQNNTDLKMANDSFKTIKEIEDEAKQIERANALDTSDRRKRMRDKGYFRSNNE